VVPVSGSDGRRHYHDAESDPHVAGYVAGRSFFAGAIAGLSPMAVDISTSLRRGKLDLGLPVLATIIILLFLRQYLIADVFVLLIVLGDLFKEYILWRVEESVNAISHALPDLAYRKTDDVRQVHVREIQVGDILVVKAGGRVPVDGVLLGTEAELDESVITGESRLVSKTRPGKRSKP